MSYDLFSMEDGNLLKTHGPDQCAGRPCALHNPSDHPLRNTVMKWDRSRNLMVRFCQHNLWHPDPDDIAHKHRSTSAAWAAQCEVHQCDGCCYPNGYSAVLESQFTWRDQIKWAWIAFLEWVKSFFRR